MEASHFSEFPYREYLEGGEVPSLLLFIDLSGVVDAVTHRLGIGESHDPTTWFNSAQPVYTGG